MLAFNITISLRGGLDVRACAERWWAIADATLSGYADIVLAVSAGTIAGVFEVRGWQRDPQNGGKVVFDLAEAAEWQWLTGQDSPVAWHKGQANPVRKIGTQIVSELRARRPHHIDAGHGWTLDVDPGGAGATVRGPGRIVVTAMDSTSARVAIAAADLRPARQARQNPPLTNREYLPL